MTPQLQAGRAQVKPQLSQEAAGDFATSFADAARLRQGVKVDQKLLQSVVGGNQ